MCEAKSFFFGSIQVRGRKPAAAKGTKRSHMHLSGRRRDYGRRTQGRCWPRPAGPGEAGRVRREGLLELVRVHGEREAGRGGDRCIGV